VTASNAGDSGTSPLSLQLTPEPVGRARSSPRCGVLFVLPARGQAAASIFLNRAPSPQIGNVKSKSKSIDGSDPSSSMWRTEQHWTGRRTPIERRGERRMSSCGLSMNRDGVVARGATGGSEEGCLHDPFIGILHFPRAAGTATMGGARMSCGGESSRVGGSCPRPLWGPVHARR
jgi:hypothetical protein